MAPLAYMPCINRSPDTIAPKIWALNSQQNVFVSQTRVCAQHTKFGVLCTTTGGHAKIVQLGVRPPYFGAELGFDVINGCKTALGGWT